MSTIGKGDWVQVIHPDAVWLRPRGVYCVAAVADVSAEPGQCPFDDCQEPGLQLDGVGNDPMAWFCRNRFKPLGGGGARIERRELADA